jgi:hypothetical protein
MKEPDGPEMPLAAGSYIHFVKAPLENIPNAVSNGLKRTKLGMLSVVMVMCGGHSDLPLFSVPIGEFFCLMHMALANSSFLA